MQSALELGLGLGLGHLNPLSHGPKTLPHQALEMLVPGQTRCQQQPSLSLPLLSGAFYPDLRAHRVRNAPLGLLALLLHDLDSLLLTFGEVQLFLGAVILLSAKGEERI